MSACTQNCVQGRACACAGGPIVISTRPTLRSRLRRWWHLLCLRQQLAGLDQEHETVFGELSDLQATRFLADEPVAQALATATISMRKLELLDISQRRIEVAKRIEAAEVAQ